jgi:hypothetical protein
MESAMKFCIVTVNNDEVVLEAEAVDNLAEFIHLAQKEGFISGRMSNDEPLIVPWHAIVGVRDVGG